MALTIIFGDDPPSTGTRQYELGQQFRFPNEILCRSKTFICNIVLIKLCNNFAVNYFLELFWNGNARYL